MNRRLIATLRVTLLALANLGLIAVVTAGVAAILAWSHPSASDIGQWAVLAILAVRSFLPRRPPS